MLQRLKLEKYVVMIVNSTGCEIRTVGMDGSIIPKEKSIVPTTALGSRYLVPSWLEEWLEEI